MGDMLLGRVSAVLSLYSLPSFNVLTCHVLVLMGYDNVSKVFCRAANNDYLHYRLIWRLVTWSIKCQKMVKNVDHGFPKPKMTSSWWLFCPDQQSSFLSQRTKETKKNHIWEAGIREIWRFVLTQNDLVSEQLAIHFLSIWLIVAALVFCIHKNWCHKPLTPLRVRL